ncbi:hypothetical protein PHLH4_30700 [Pseudomonas sp. St316]|nr:hypothetical protein PHLH4_30700 [Pseudomonas sp. St316]
MKNDKHYFNPERHNEMHCELCGGHLADSQHIRAQMPQPNQLAEVRSATQSRFASASFAPIWYAQRSTATDK